MRRGAPVCAPVVGRTAGRHAGRPLPGEMGAVENPSSDAQSLPLWGRCPRRGRRGPSQSRRQPASSPGGGFKGKASQSLRPQAQIHQIRVLVRLCRAKTHFSAGGVCERSECMKRLLPSRRQSFLCRRFKPSPKGKALWCVAGTTFPHPVSVFSFPRTGTKTAGCAPAGDAR